MIGLMSERKAVPGRNGWRTVTGRGTTGQRGEALPVPQAVNEGTIIPVLTRDGLGEIRRVADGPGQHAKAWTAVTRLVRERLGQGSSSARADLGRECRRGSRGHYLRLSMDAAHELEIAFGMISAAGQQIMIATLNARWGTMGLMGPYRILIRDTPESLATFYGALGPYLTLPPEPHKAT